MGLAPIPEADWLPEPPDRDARLAARRTVLSAHPEEAHACPDAARPAAEEALALVAAHRGVAPPQAVSPLLAAVIEGLDATERRLRRLDRVGPGLLRFLHAAAHREGVAS